MLRLICLASVVTLTAAVLLAAPVPKNALPALGKTNANTLIKEYKEKLVIDASSEWEGWPVANAFDSDEKTSWYSISGESATNGKEPWVRVRFPVNDTVRRVTIHSTFRQSARQSIAELIVERMSGSNFKGLGAVATCGVMKFTNRMHSRNYLDFPHEGTQQQQHQFWEKIRAIRVELMDDVFKVRP